MTNIILSKTGERPSSIFFFYKKGLEATSGGEDPLISYLLLGNYTPAGISQTTILSNIKANQSRNPN